MKVKDLNFVEIKTLPNVITLGEVGIGYKSLRLYNINDPKAPGYLLSDFLEDYYQFEFQAFRVRFYEKILNPLNSDGYLANGEKRMPIRDLAYFVKELNAGLERGKWVKSVFRNVNISTSHVNIIAEFIDTVIRNERLRMSDIIMLKYLKRMNSQVFSMLKIFSSVDVRDKQSLLNKIVTYADGFFGTNEDYSEDIDRLEIDIIRSLEGGCNKSERKTNDESKRIYHPKVSNNNCFFKCIQSFIPELMEKIIRRNVIKLGINLDLQKILKLTCRLR